MGRSVFCGAPLLLCSVLPYTAAEPYRLLGVAPFNQQLIEQRLLPAQLL